MIEKSPNVVPILKYAQANENFVTQLSKHIREQTNTLTKSTEPLIGAVIVLYGKDSIKTIRFRLTLELTELIIELGYAYPIDREPTS